MAITLTQEAALFDFFNSFGIDAYEETQVPSDAEFPYITYSMPHGDFLNGEVMGSCSVFDYGSSWAKVNEVSRGISNKIGLGGVLIKCEGGAIWLKRGTPFMQNMSDTENDFIHRKYLVLIADFLSIN